MEFPKKPGHSDKPGGEPRRPSEPGSKDERAGENRRAGQRGNDPREPLQKGDRQADGERREDRDR